VLVSGIVLRQQTPMPDVPIAIGDASGTSDSSGEFSLEVPGQRSLSITSGLAAISFPPITGSGLELSQTYHRIEVSPLIEPLEVCKVSIDGAPFLFFSYFNQADFPLTVPSGSRLNQFEPKRGYEPESIFLAAESGFVRPYEIFASGDRWILLGDTISVQEPIPVCTDRGDTGGCSPIPSAIKAKPFAFAKSAITILSRRAEKLLRGLPRQPSRRTSPPFFASGSATLAGIRRIMNTVPSAALICDPAPSMCQVRKYPRAALQKEFARLCKVKLPPELQGLMTDCRRERRRFRKYLARELPGSFTDCSG